MIFFNLQKVNLKKSGFMYINSENVHGYKKKLYHWRNRINWPMLTQKQNLSFVLIDKDEHITNKSKKYKNIKRYINYSRS